MKNRFVSFLKRMLNKKRDLRANFPGSKNYWEQRYVNNKNSGSGSYGRLAEFKANIINSFVKENDIKTVLEFGCGDGNQLSLANYPNYVGLDVSTKAIELCKEQFKKDDSKSFFVLNTDLDISFNHELVLSLDVLYHLIEDVVFNDYMESMFNTAEKYVIIYSSNYDKEVDIHVKCRKFSKWIDKNVSSQWILVQHIENKYPYDSKDPNNTSMSDFYIYKKIV